MIKETTTTTNVPLPAFARRTPAVQQSIDIFYPPGPQQQTRSSGTDKRTDSANNNIALSVICCSLQHTTKRANLYLRPEHL